MWCPRSSRFRYVKFVRATLLPYLVGVMTGPRLGLQVSISTAGHDSYSAREGRHDDLVYAAAQLCWYRDWFCQPTDDAIAAAHRPAVARR